MQLSGIAHSVSQDARAVVCSQLWPPNACCALRAPPKSYVCAVGAFVELMLPRHRFSELCYCRHRVCSTLFQLQTAWKEPQQLAGKHASAT